MIFRDNAVYRSNSFKYERKSPNLGVRIKTLDVQTPAPVLAANKAESESNSGEQSPASVSPPPTATQEAVSVSVIKSWTS